MANQPLAQSRADQRRFVDRTRETDAIIRAVAASQPVLLLGERGSGRTSLLNHVAWLLARQKESRHTLIVSGELASNSVPAARRSRRPDPAARRAGRLPRSLDRGPAGALDAGRAVRAGRPAGDLDGAGRPPRRAARRAGASCVPDGRRDRADGCPRGVRESAKRALGAPGRHLGRRRRQRLPRRCTWSRPRMRSSSTPSSLAR